MDQKLISIIGAGIAGLSAGCYGQMNGYRTQIFEMHDKPGGLCTSWKRKGYTIDGCLQWLAGSNPAGNFYRIWEELGAVQGRRMINHDEYMRIESADGKVFILYTDIDRLEQHMYELAPQDKDVIKKFIKGIRTFTHFDFPIEKAPELYGPLDYLKMMFKMLPFMMAMRKWKTGQDFAKRFKDPFLREAFLLLSDLPDFPAIVLMIILAFMHQKSCGYPEGGSLEFARAIERRYLGLGGELHYRSKVPKILVENNQAVGIRLADGREHRGDIIISAADGHTTIFDMLEGRYIDDKIRGYYDKMPIFRPLVQVSLGLARDLSNEPYAVTLLLDKQITIAGEVRKSMYVGHYCFDPTLAPPGKSVVVVSWMSNYNYWKKLYEDRERYKAEKERIANTVIALLEKRFPGINRAGRGD